MKNDFENICEAAFEGDIEKLSSLLLNKINLNQKGVKWTPLHSAIENENLECVKLLLENGANVEFVGTEGEGFPLDHAVDIAVQSNINTGGKEGGENLEIISVLLEAGADPTTAIQTAENYGCIKILTTLNFYLEKRKNIIT